MVKFEIPIYGLTAQGKKISIGKTFRTLATAKRCGGKIFYIDNSASGATYHFYDSEGYELTDVQVGDEPYCYTVTGTPTKDKYYTFYPNAVTQKTWTYHNGSDWVFESCGTNEVIGIGAGKTNTATVMAKDDGAYIWTGVQGTSLWYSLNNMRVNAVAGCDDWFVPSPEELYALVRATDRQGNYLINNPSLYFSTSTETGISQMRVVCRTYGESVIGKANMYQFHAIRSF